MRRYFSVSLKLPLRNSTYTYYSDEEGPLVFRRVKVNFNHRTLTGFVVGEVEKPSGEYEILPILRVLDKEEVINPEHIFLSSEMAFLYKCSEGEALSLMVPNAKIEKDSSLFDAPSSFRRIEQLSPDQERVLYEIGEKRKEGKRIFYIYGVTGCGKSEVYLRLAEREIEKGNQVLYLVPEITLSEQLSAEVYERFDKKVSILHSALTASQRLKAHNAIKDGSVSLVIGARSAVFAPFRSLGLIIIDEEHETSYKSGSTPRYHARQIAQMRLSYNKNAYLVMGSATPSFESFEKMREGRIVALRMRNRIGEGAFPSVRVVNILSSRNLISEPLKIQMEKEFREKKGVILFLNRRGYSKSLVCNTCGEVFLCPNCSVSLTYHRKDRRLECHMCGYSEPVPSSCPNCSSRDIMTIGYGTERIEDEIRKLFPFRTIRRLDSDSAKGKREYIASALSDFREGKVDILLGTQMIAKGLNFPLVSLVGIINADTSLSLPDFRANERTYSLLLQVAGRVGRYRPDGKVIIQTSFVSNRAIRAVELNESEEFYYKELDERRKLSYPPYSRLINFTLRSKDEERAERTAISQEEVLRQMAGKIAGVEIFPATSSLVEKLNGSYRYHVLVSAKESAFFRLLKAVDSVIAVFRLPYNVYLEIDTDPVDLF